MNKDELILKECETWSCWNDLDELEQDEVIEGYGKIYEAGKKSAFTIPQRPGGQDSHVHCRRIVDELEARAESLVKVVRNYHGDICDGDPEHCETCAELENWI